MLDRFFALFRAITWLKRSALAQERIATALEEILMREAGGGSGLRTFYNDRGGAQGEVFSQSDEDMARLEELEQRRVKNRGDVGLEDDLEE